MNISFNGIIFSIISSAIFGFIPLLVMYLPYDSLSILCGRIIVSSIIGIIVLAIGSHWGEFCKIFNNSGLLVTMLGCSFLVMLINGLFIWAPINGKARELANGFLLSPIVLVLVTQLIYKHKLTIYQTVAIIFASIAVVLSLIEFSCFSWVTFIIPISSTVYFLLRNTQSINVVVSLFFESVIFLPMALMVLSFDRGFSKFIVDGYENVFLLLSFCLLSNLALFFYIKSYFLLHTVVFGMLSYLEPIILLLVAVLLLDEPVSQNQWVVHGFIGLTVLFSIADNINRIRGKPWS